ncbi:MAG: AAA family ATPase, partial [Chloroflexi bacterium]|nr:AAA family ATPase [Chloroflexota bacterium]
ECALYLATAPKSNSCGAYFQALKTVEQEGLVEVPNHLRDGNRDAATLGHGQGYRYPHAFPGHWIAQQYLPDALQGRQFYQPGQEGYEQLVAQRLRRRRPSREETNEPPTGE